MKSFRFFLLALICALATSLAQQTTVTPQVGLQIPGYGASNWHVPLNYDMSLLDKLLSGQLPIPALQVSGSASFSGKITTDSSNGINFFPGAGTRFTNAGGFLSRWFVVTQGNETGTGNAGSNWTLNRYADAGSYIDTPINVPRSTGNVLIGGGTDDGTNKLQVLGTVAISGKLRMPAPSQTAASPNFGTSVIPTANGGASYVYGMGNTDGSLSIGQTDPAFSAFMQIRGGNYKTGDASAAVSGIQFIRGTSAGFEQMAQFANTITFSMPVSASQIQANHIGGAGSTPTFACGAVAGTCTGVSIVGTDQSGTISFTTGTTAPSAGGTIAAVTFASAYPTAARCTVSAASPFAGTNIVATYVSSGTNGVSLLSTNGALPSTTAYVFNYVCGF